MKNKKIKIQTQNIWILIIKSYDLIKMQTLTFVKTKICLS